MVPLFMERICSIMVCYIGRMTYCYNKATGNREKGEGKWSARKSTSGSAVR